MNNSPDISKVLKWSEIHSLIVLLGAILAFWWDAIGLLCASCGTFFSFITYTIKDLISLN